MQFSTAVFALATAAVAFAADITVQVGDTGLAFTPSSITVQAGDNVIFEFHAKNHSVTQSTFADPCSLMTTPSVGIDSGFQPVTATSPPFPTWNITIQNASTPLWFFCAQTSPVSHCNSGMVFAINPTAAKSFEAFQATAMALANATSSTPATGASSAVSADPSAIAGATDSTSATVDVPTASAGATDSTSATSVNVPAASASDASSAQTSATLSAQTTAPTTTNGAMRLGTSASSLLAIAGLLAGLML